ncbi:hypothetical protein [Legionella quinlivanii]
MKDLIDVINKLEAKGIGLQL